ncbi:MAG TPA: circadian clock KaiB family protein [Methylomirabilota bacterium]|nr:circadian clock KaiB family protein [Methylomirabilota bacterium]
MSRPVTFKFRLYVAGNTPNSLKALANLKALCRTHLPEQHEIEIVDVFREPNRALTERILMTPTLVKLSPAPVCTIVGTLSRTESVLQTLGLELPTVAA